MPLTGLTATATATGGLYTNSSLTWVNWNTSSSTMANTITLNNGIWRSWNTGTSATATGATWNSTEMWVSWNGARLSPSTYGRMNRGGYEPATETPEHRAARELRERRWAEEEAIRTAARKEAERRAEALLLANLNEEQRAQLARDDWFLIDTASGKKYRINRGRSANIDVIDERGETVRSLCVHPRDNVPDADTMLAQVLMLRHEEDELLRIANVHGIHHGFRRRPVPAPIALPRAA